MYDQPLSATPPRPAAGFLPKEHGSWSLALEPIVLGLLVAPTRAGCALATAAFAGFLARRPLKTAFAAGDPAPRASAGRTLALLSFLALAGLAEAFLLGGAGSLWPLLLAAPLGGLFVFFDAAGESRAAAAELAGSAAFALLPAAAATLAGWHAIPALAFTAVALARSAPTVLTVRAYLRSSKGQVAPPAMPVLAATAGLATAGLLGWARWVPPLAVAGAAVLLVRTIWLSTPWRPRWPARRIGLGEAVLGVCYVAFVAFAYRTR